MAYREPETLSCPTCEITGDLVWVIGEGPNTKPGQAPDYVDVLDPGSWHVKTIETAPVWHGVITCSNCKETVRRYPPDP